jgi:hypothetical protein
MSEEKEIHNPVHKSELINAQQEVFHGFTTSNLTIKGI